MRPVYSLACRASRRGAGPSLLRQEGLRPVLPSSSSAGRQLPQRANEPSRRHLFGFSLFGKKKSDGDEAGSSVSDIGSSSSTGSHAHNARGPTTPKQVLLSQDNLFHLLSKSPIPAMRARGDRVRSLAPCPVSLNRDGVRRLVKYECPQCGWPTHYSEVEYKQDTEHAKYIARLREANEDEHDLRSGREMTEFKLPGPQGFEEVINFSSWDIFFYTRNHDSIETDRSRRHVSKLLTFPATVAGVLHENSPYTKRNGRLTHEGLRSLVALRQTLHPVLGSKPSLDVVRLFVVGARAESSLPAAVWDQLRHMFPNVPLHIFMIGPEVSMTRAGETSSGALNRTRHRPSNYGVPSKTAVISEGITLTTIQANYEEVHEQLAPFDPYTDAFFAFSPGFGFPSVVGQAEINRARWEERDERQRMAAARDTYNAKGAPPITEASEGSTGRTTTEGDLAASTATTTSPASTAQPTDAANPEGGDVPAKEPPPVQPALTSAEMPAGRYTSLTTAPIVQAQREWARALGQMLSTKCALISTGFSPADVERDILAFESVEGIQGEFEWLINPGENVFASQQWAVADFDPRVAVKANWGIWAVRGKRYDIEGPSPWSGGWRGGAEQES